MRDKHKSCFLVSAEGQRRTREGRFPFNWCFFFCFFPSVPGQNDFTNSTHIFRSSTAYFFCPSIALQTNLNDFSDSAPSPELCHRVASCSSVVFTAFFFSFDCGKTTERGYVSRVRFADSVTPALSDDTDSLWLKSEGNRAASQVELIHSSCTGKKSSINPKSFYLPNSGCGFCLI